LRGETGHEAVEDGFCGLGAGLGCRDGRCAGEEEAGAAEEMGGKHGNTISISSYLSISISSYLSISISSYLSISIFSVVSRKFVEEFAIRKVRRVEAVRAPSGSFDYV
jgi:hypothetical protein